MKIQTFTIVAGTSLCNARCPFCISQMTPKQGITFEEPEVNWLNFRKACRLAQMHDVTTVLITGKGEPTLYPQQITLFLKHLKEFDFPIIELQTNGLALGREFNKYKPYLGLNTIAISVVHYNENKNKEIYTGNANYPNLENLINNLHQMGFTVRLSVMLLKNFIDSPEEIQKLVDKVRQWTVEQLTLRPIDTPKEAENASIYTWTKNHELTRGQIFEIDKFLKSNAVKLLTFAHGGVVYDLHGQNVCFTNGLATRPETDNLRCLIFFPDGHLRYDWQYGGAILI